MKLKIFLLTILALHLFFLSGCNSLRLKYAIVHGDVPMLNDVLKNGKDINEKDFNGRHPLFAATMSGEIEIVRYLIERGADLNLKTDDIYGQTALMNAAALGRTDIVKLLVESGAKLDLETNKGLTALMFSSAFGHSETVSFLLKKGAKLDTKNIEGKTALDIAVLNNRYTVAEILRSAGDGKQYPFDTTPTPPSGPSFSGVKNTGTGWITEGGYIVTNHHVIEGHGRISVRFFNFGDKEYPAEVVIDDEINDLSILKITDQIESKPTGLPIATKLPRIGAEVFTVGYPKSDVMGLNPKVTNGIVSALSGIKDDPRVIQTTVAIQSGNSGGPLLNLKGEVVGVTMASLRTKVTDKGIDVPQGVNYAVKSAYVSALLTSVPERSHPMGQARSATLEELIPIVQDSIVQVTSTSNSLSDEKSQ